MLRQLLGRYGWNVTTVVTDASDNSGDRSKSPLVLAGVRIVSITVETIRSENEARARRSSFFPSPRLPP